MGGDTLEIYSTVWKGSKEGQEYTKGDYWFYDIIGITDYVIEIFWDFKVFIISMWTDQINAIIIKRMHVSFA